MEKLSQCCGVLCLSLEKKCSSLLEEYKWPPFRGTYVEEYGAEASLKQKTKMEKPRK